MLTEKPTTTDLIPPPKPPPTKPTSLTFERKCELCGAVEGDGRPGCLESLPPQHRFIPAGRTA